ELSTVLRTLLEDFSDLLGKIVRGAQAPADEADFAFHVAVQEHLAIATGDLYSQLERSGPGHCSRGARPLAALLKGLHLHPQDHEIGHIGRRAVAAAIDVLKLS